MNIFEHIITSLFEFFLKRLQHIVVLHDSQQQQQQQNAGHMNIWTSSTGRAHRNVSCIIATIFISATINTTYVTDHTAQANQLGPK